MTSLFHQRTLPLSRRAACDVVFRSPRRLVARNFFMPCGAKTEPFSGRLSVDKNFLSRVVRQRGEPADIWPGTSFGMSTDERKRNGAIRIVERPQPGNNWSPRPLTFFNPSARLLGCVDANNHHVLQRHKSPDCNRGLSGEFLKTPISMSFFYAHGGTVCGPIRTTLGRRGAV